MVIVYLGVYVFGLGVAINAVLSRSWTNIYKIAAIILIVFGLPFYFYILYLNWFKSGAGWLPLEMSMISGIVGVSLLLVILLWRRVTR